jgi:hypothetical protein
MKLNEDAVENFLDHFSEIAYLDRKQQKEIFLKLFDVDEKIESFIRYDILSMDGSHEIDGETYSEKELKELTKS